MYHLCCDRHRKWLSFVLVLVLLQNNWGLILSECIINDLTIHGVLSTISVGISIKNKHVLLCLQVVGILLFWFGFFFSLSANLYRGIFL